MDVLTRREHLITEVAVTILYVGIVVMPHQQDPLLNRVQPHHDYIVQHTGVFGRVHYFSVLVINFKVFPYRVPMLIQICIDFQASSIRIPILIFDLLNPLISLFIDF